MDEKLLVKRMLNGDEQAINLFYRGFRPKILSHVQRKVPFGRAEELTQEIFIGAFQSLPRYKAKASLSSWLLAIARHEIADYYRKKKIKEIVFSRLPFLKKLVTEALSPDVAYEEKELKLKIKRTFSRLSEGYCQILRLKYCEGFSVAQVADKFGISYKSAESKIFRARLAFQREFEQQSQKGHQTRNPNYSS